MNAEQPEQGDHISIDFESMGILRQPTEISCAILAAAAGQTCMQAESVTRILNRLALVARSWHAMLSPPTGGCIPALTRRVTLRNNMVAQYSQPWWSWVNCDHNIINSSPAAGSIVLASLAAGCPNITDLDLSRCHITDAGLSSP